MKRIAILASGGGTNLQSILDHFADLGSASPAEVALVASDRPQAAALGRARSAGVQTAVLDRHASTPQMLELFAEAKIDFLVLAGYLKLIPTAVVDRYAHCMVNVHPALLPKHGGPGMYGLRVHQAVIRAGERVTGPTVHRVTHELDSGPVLAQWPVGVLDTDDAMSLAARVQVAEHALYPRVIEALLRGDETRFPMCPDENYFAHAPITPDDITRDIIAAFR